MNITKSVGIVTGAIPIVGILIGGITFGINFKTDVDNLKEDVAHQEEANITLEERFNGLNVAPYDDSLLWLQTDTLIERINDIYIPDGYDDSNINTRLQELALDLTSLQVEVDGIEIGDTSDLQAQVSELSGQLNALSNIDMTSDDGTIDISPLIVRIASVEGSLNSFKSSIDTLKSDMRTVKSDITALERKSINSGGSSRTVEKVENPYDDTNLRNRVSTVERQLNSLPAPSSGGNTIQRIENPFDDSSLRADISRLQTAVAVLEATPNNTYDDSNLRDMINDIQWELNNIEIPVATTNTDNEWLEDLIHNVKQELNDRINELEWASTSSGNDDDDMYAEHWMIEDLQYQVMHIQEQVWELQEIANSYGATTNNNTTTSSNTTSSNTTDGRSWDGSWTEPHHLYVKHKDTNGNHTYTGDYWMDGYWDGKPVWVNWECGTGQWQFCYIFKYNNTSWVIQPLEPSTEWLANAYNDNGEWPWEGSWSGDVEHIEVKN